MALLMQQPPAALPELAAAALDTIANAQSPHTTAAYAGAWARFGDFAAQAGLTAMPSAPQTIILHLQAMADAGAAPASISAARSAIAAAHRAAGHDNPNPAAAAPVKQFMQGIARQAQPQRQAAALLPEHLAAIKATANRPRIGRGGAMESTTTANARGAMDYALACLLHDAGLRISELIAIRWQDIESLADDSGRLMLVRAKQRGAAAQSAAALTPRTMAALDAIRPIDANPGAVVIPLTGRQASNRIKAMLTAAGFDGNAFSGHSGRVGLARAMSSAGAPDSIIARQAGWKDPKMVSRYTRRETAAAALRYMAE